MTFDADFAADAFPDLLSEFGEEVQFRTSATDASPRTIDAIVNRDPVVPLTAMPNELPSYSITVDVYNDATLGVSSATIDRGVNQIYVADAVGKTAKWKVVTQIVNDDGVLRLGLK